MLDEIEERRNRLWKTTPPPERKPSPLPKRKLDANPIDSIIGGIREAEPVAPAMVADPEPAEDRGWIDEEDDYSFAADDDEVDTVEDDVYC